MRRQHVWLAVGLLLAIATLTVYAVRRAPASGAIISTVEVVGPAATAPPPTAAPGEPPTDTPAAPDSETLVQEVTSLVERWTGPLLQGPSWLHLLEEHERGSQDAGALPNNIPIPARFLKDSWYHLHPNGQVVEAVSWMRDLDGGILQETAFANGTWFNLTTGEQFQAGTAPLRLDFGFTEALARGPAWYGTLSRQETTLEGEAAVRFITREAAAEGTPAVETRVAFSPETGQLLLYEMVEIQPDGTERLLFRARFLTIERAEAPPPEVLAVLEEVQP